MPDIAGARLTSSHFHVVTIATSFEKVDHFLRSHLDMRALA